MWLPPLLWGWGGEGGAAFDFFVQPFQRVGGLDVIGGVAQHLLDLGELPANLFEEGSFVMTVR